MFNDVFILQGCATDTFATAVLGAVVVDLGAFYVSGAGDGDDDFFFWDEVFDGHVAVVTVKNLSASVVPVLFNNAGEFFGYDFALAGRGF